MELFKCGDDLDGYQCFSGKKNLINISFHFYNNWRTVKSNINAVSQFLRQEGFLKISIESGVHKMHLDLDWDEKILFVDVSLAKWKNPSAPLVEDIKGLAADIYEMLKFDSSDYFVSNEADELFSDFYHEQD